MYHIKKININGKSFELKLKPLVMKRLVVKTIYKEIIENKSDMWQAVSSGMYKDALFAGYHFENDNGVLRVYGFKGMRILK